MRGLVDHCLSNMLRLFLEVEVVRFRNMCDKDPFEDACPLPANGLSSVCVSVVLSWCWSNIACSHTCIGAGAASRGRALVPHHALAECGFGALHRAIQEHGCGQAPVQVCVGG